MGFISNQTGELISDIEHQMMSRAYQAAQALKRRSCRCCADRAADGAIAFPVPVHPTLRPPRDNRRQYGQVRTGRLMFREPNRSPETYTAL